MVMEATFWLHLNEVEVHNFSSFPENNWEFCSWKYSHPYSYLLHSPDCNSARVAPCSLHLNLDAFKDSPVFLIDAVMNEVCSSSLLLYADLKRAPLQVTWIYEPKDGERMNIAVFHPNFGPNYPESQMKGRVTFKPSPPELSSPSIEISNVRMTDEGRYVCEYATYPDGNEQGITQLVMLGRSQS